ncbi:MAG: hypothetical protein FJ096_18870, partial [Deltaproteobacteria bacterium]|nr:hypothetical protein [Deltaproteobacteria bacterium]
LVGRVPPSDVSITGFDDIGSETWMLVETRRALPMPEFPTRVGASAGDVKEPQPPAITAALPKAPDTPTPPVAPASKPAAARPWPNRVVRVAAVSPGEVTIDAGKADGLAVGDWIGVHRVLPASKLQPQFVERQRVSVVRVIAVKDDQSLCEVPRGARIRVGDALERAQAGEDALIYPDRQASILDVTATLRPLVKVGAPLGGGSSSTARSPTSARATSSARGSSPLAWAGRRKATSSRRASSPRPATTRSPWGSALASA